MTIGDFEAHVDRNLERLHRELREQTYQPQAGCGVGHLRADVASLQSGRFSTPAKVPTEAGDANVDVHDRDISSRWFRREDRDETSSI